MNIAVYKEREYYKGELVNGQIFIDSLVEDFAKIGDWQDGISITEELLESFNIPNLGYIKTKGSFKLFDKSNETYSEEELPVYVDVFGSPRNTKKWTLVKTPTKEAIAASKAIAELVNTELFKLQHAKHIQEISEKLEAGNGLAYVYYNSSLYKLHLWDYIPGARVLLELAPNIFVVGTKAAALEVELKVPEAYVPAVIGRGGANAKFLASEIGAKYVKVTAL